MTKRRRQIVELAVIAILVWCVAIVMYSHGSNMPYVPTGSDVTIGEVIKSFGSMWRPFLTLPLMFCRDRVV